LATKAFHFNGLQSAQTLILNLTTAAAPDFFIGAKANGGADDRQKPAPIIF